MALPSILQDRASSWAFALGVIGVTAGVLLHLPMFWMGRDMGFRLAGMPMDSGMLAGMVLILAGVVLAAWGLLPKNVAEQVQASRHISIAAPEDAPLTKAHWQLMAVLVDDDAKDSNNQPGSIGVEIEGWPSKVSVRNIWLRKLR